MLLYGIVWVSLILLYITEVKRVPILGDKRATVAGAHAHS